MRAETGLPFAKELRDVGATKILSRVKPIESNVFKAAVAQIADLETTCIQDEDNLRPMSLNEWTAPDKAID